LKVLVIAVAISTLVVGCGVYSFSSSTLGGIKTIAVPQFENKSLQYGIQEELTSQVIDNFIADNTLKVVSQSDADAVLRGVVTNYERTYYTYDKNDNVSSYRVNITVDFTLEKKDGKVVLERKGMTDFGIYDAAGETEQDGQVRAINKLAQDIVDETTKSW
jgi:hypothetical protein